MLKRNFVSFFMAIFLYVSLWIFLWYLQQYYVKTVVKPQEKIISFSLATYEPEVKKVVNKIEEVIEKPNLVKEQKIEEVPREEPKLEPKPQPIVKPKIKKVISKPIVVKKKIVKKRQNKKKIKKKSVKRKKSKTVYKHKKVVKKSTSSTNSVTKTSAVKKNAFYSKIRSRINGYKTYPRMARRRRMQGNVKVRFTILANGSVANITLSGPKVFYNSARKAVKKAFPISVQNAPLKLPTTINLTLRYQIK